MGHYEAASIQSISVESHSKPYTSYSPYTSIYRAFPHTLILLTHSHRHYGGGETLSLLTLTLTSPPPLHDFSVPSSVWIPGPSQYSLQNISPDQEISALTRKYPTPQPYRLSDKMNTKTRGGKYRQRRWEGGLLDWASWRTGRMDGWSWEDGFHIQLHHTTHQIHHLVSPPSRTHS